MNTTIKQYKTEIETLQKTIYSYADTQPYSNRQPIYNEMHKIFAKHLDGRYYIHSRAKKVQVENIYEDLVNYMSDNHIEGF